MKISRQTFLRMSGLSLVAMAVSKVARAVTPRPLGHGHRRREVPKQENCTKCIDGMPPGAQHSVASRPAA